MNAPAKIGHNGPPDPLDDALAPYSDAIEEAQNWLDGTKVENEDQMKAVDALLRDIKAAAKAVDTARDAEAKPLHDAWKACIARFTPTQDDLNRIKKGLVAVVDAFKRRIAAEKAEAERKARAEAEAARRAAEEAARAASDADLDAQRKVARLMAEAKAAQATLTVTQRDKVKGLRTVTRYEIEDHRAALHWIAKNDRDAMTAFVDEYVRRNHTTASIDGVQVWQDREAF